jgi:CHAD domain-containing protein
MKKCTLNKKLNNLTVMIDTLLQNNEDSVTFVHSLRKKTRELLSLVATTDPFYPKLKKIIKLSNNIRDIDVFLNAFLESLKLTQKKTLDINKIILISKNTRSKLFNQLYLYLEKLNIPKVVKDKSTLQNLKTFPFLEKKPLIFEQKALHKYRIHIKKIIYSLKNNKEKKEIVILTTLKDLLGKINDNYNGLNRLEKFDIGDKLFQEIQEHIMKKNSKYFDKIQKLNKQL